MISKPKDTVLAVFGKDFPAKSSIKHTFDTVVAEKMFKKRVEALGCQFVELETLVEPGSIYEATDFAEELSRLTLPDGSRIAKSAMYKGYELWWINYGSLFINFCLPYTRYKKLLEYLRNFQSIHFYKLPHKSLFSCYLRAHGRRISLLREPGLKSPSALPFGVLLQILITLFSMPILMVRKRRVMLFTGDKFEKSKDYDPRMKFIYQELRERNIPFVEFIRSLESWKTIVAHAFTRRRPVIYSEGVAFVGRFASVLSGGRARARRKFGAHIFASVKDRETRFKLLVATQYLLGVQDDIEAIRIMKWILRAIGVKVAIITTATERNFHSVLGCKLNAIPTVGILHGVASRFYNVYDFLPAFDGTKMLSVDQYGVWSEWWKDYYIKYSKAYKPEQLVVSGPMRPLQKLTISSGNPEHSKSKKVKVLLVSEIVAVPTEVMPYLNTILKVKDFSVYIKFRAYNDTFEKWLKDNCPDVLNRIGKERILKGSMDEAIGLCDVVIGSQSTGVIEATLQSKPFVFFKTKKWGDYLSMKSADEKYHFFAENEEELIDYIKESLKIPKTLLKQFCDKFFGDPYKNGSAWVVDRVEQLLK